MCCHNAIGVVISMATLLATGSVNDANHPHRPKNNNRRSRQKKALALFFCFFSTGGVVFGMHLVESRTQHGTRLAPSTIHPCRFVRAHACTHAHTHTHTRRFTGCGDDVDS